MYYSVCASAVYEGVPLSEAIGRIRAAGANAYEFWSWWDQDLDAVEAAQRAAGLKPAALCTRFIPLNDPARRADYISGLRQSISVARRLGCPTLISQIGQALADVPREAQHDCIAEGLRACAPILEDAGVTLVIEPLNVLVNHPGYYLTSSAEGFELVRQAQSPNVRLLFDVYHQQITEGNLIANLTANAPLIGHIHVAGNPGRHEILGESEIHYPSVFAALKRAGYDGAVGLEYFPLNDPDAGLRELLRTLPLDA